MKPIHTPRSRRGSIPTSLLVILALVAIFIALTIDDFNAYQAEANRYAALERELRATNVELKVWREKKRLLRTTRIGHEILARENDMVREGETVINLAPDTTAPSR